MSYRRTPSGTATTCNGRSTSTDTATISPTTSWQTVSSYNAGYINKITQKANGDIIINAERYGKNVELYHPNSGSAFISDIRSVIGSGASSGELGEKASDVIMKGRGWSEASGFLKNNVNQQGIDGIYIKDGKYCLVESKFSSASGNFYKNDLESGYGYTQMSDNWIGAALLEMKTQGTITESLYKDILENAWKNGNVKKELIITRNTADDGYTIGKSIAQDTSVSDVNSRVNLDRITIINLGGNIV